MLIHAHFLSPSWVHGVDGGIWLILANEMRVEIMHNKTSRWKLLGTALPGFRSCNSPWLRLSERPWDHKPLRRQRFSPWQGCHLCPLYFTLLGPEPDQLANDREDSSREGRPKTGIVTKRSSGKDLGSYRKRGWWALAPQLWHSLSPHSVCKKSPNLLAALLPLPDLSLKQW